MIFENGVAGAEPPYRSSAICATASCSGFVRLTASILAWSRGGSPTFSPGKDAGRVCSKLCTMQSLQSIHSLSPGKGVFGKDAEIRTHQALHEAKPTECPKGDRD